MELPVRLATVHRKKDKHAVAVMDHEIPILELLYGEGSVQIEDHDYDTRKLDDSAAIEHARLVGVYASKNHNPVSIVYPTPHDLRRYGFGAGATRANEREQAVVKDRRKDSKPAGDSEAAELRAKLDELGVKYHPRAGVEKLRALVAEANKGQ